MKLTIAKCGGLAMPSNLPCVLWDAVAAEYGTTMTLIGNVQRSPPIQQAWPLKNSTHNCAKITPPKTPRFAQQRFARNILGLRGSLLSSGDHPKGNANWAARDFFSSFGGNAWTMDSQEGCEVVHQFVRGRDSWVLTVFISRRSYSSDVETSMQNLL